VKIVITFGVADKNFANVFYSISIIMQSEITKKNNICAKRGNGNHFGKLLITVG
jgi:hypothetical protein